MASSRVHEEEIRREAPEDQGKNVSVSTPCNMFYAIVLVFASQKILLPIMPV